MRRRMRQFLLCIVGGLFALLAVAVLFDRFAPPPLALPAGTLTVLSAVVLVIAVPLFVIMIAQIEDAYRALERVRGFIVMMQTDEAESVPSPLPGEMPREVQELLDAVDALIRGRLAQQALPVQQLEAVLSSIPHGIVVINHAGLVGLVNAAAKARLGAEALTVGTSVYDALTPSALDAALALAHRQDGAVETTVTAVDGRSLRVRAASVGDRRGAVLVLESSADGHAQEIDHDLRLLDVPPKPVAFSDDTPLDALPIFVFDLETTGLDVEADSILSVGGVRMVGDRIYRAATMDRLVNPGRLIPPRSTAIHGITDDMVAEAAGFPEVWRDLHMLMHGTVLVGHNVGFDIAHLRTATRQAGIEWTPPPYLCTYLLVAALDSGLPSVGLDTVAREFGVAVRGRHTALGDALVTAEVFARLVHRLADRGIATLGAAKAFAHSRTDLLKLQAQSGWWIGEAR